MEGLRSSPLVIYSPSGQPVRSAFTRRTARPTAGTVPFPYWGQSSFFAAQPSTGRGQLILPPERLEDALRPADRTLLALKSRVLVDNYGPAGALWHLANLIGSLKAQAMSSDHGWNGLANVYWDRVTGSPLTFDASGRHTIATYQVMTTFQRLVDGDCFSILTLSQSGHGRVMGHEGLCVAAGPNQKSPEWIDGIQCDPKTRFPLAYNFIDRGPKGERSNTILPAISVIHHNTLRSFSARRGLPVLAHAINHFTDIIETIGFQKQMIKVAALVGLTLKGNEAAATGNPFNVGLGGPMQQGPWVSPTSGTAPTTVPEVKMKFEEAVEGGLMGTRPMEVVHDERPHPNGEEFKKSLLKEAANGIGFPAELLYYLDNPGGAWTRVILDDAAKEVAAIQANHLAPMMRRLWWYVILLGIKKGDLPAPTASDWMKIRLTPPRTLTADLGRMGRLMIELRRACLTTFARQYEELGYSWEEETEQCAKEFAHMIKLEEKYHLPPGSMTQCLLPAQAAAAILTPDYSPAEPAQKAA